MYGQGSGLRGEWSNDAAAPIVILLLSRAPYVISNIKIDTFSRKFVGIIFLKS